MLLTSEMLDAIRNECESVEFGEVLIKLNSKGSFMELETTHRTRLSKEGDTSVYEGRTRVFRTDC